MKIVRSRLSGGLLVLCAFLAFTVPAGSGSVDDLDPYLERGGEVLSPFKTSLMSALGAGMKNGPGAAIEVCRVRAPEIASEAADDTIRIGRISHKPRNPLNSPKPWMEPLLEAYLANPEKKDPAVVLLENGGVGYVEPIHMKKICLTCHGSKLEPSIGKKIDTLYPDDKAKGFQEGEFRGLFWVEFERE